MLYKKTKRRVIKILTKIAISSITVFWAMLDKPSQILVFWLYFPLDARWLTTLLLIHNFLQSDDNKFNLIASSLPLVISNG